MNCMILCAYFAPKFRIGLQCQYCISIRYQIIVRPVISLLYDSENKNGGLVYGMYYIGYYRYLCIKHMIWICWVVHVCDLFSQMYYLTCDEEQYWWLCSPAIHHQSILLDVKCEWIITSPKSHHSKGIGCKKVRGERLSRKYM